MSGMGKIVAPVLVLVCFSTTATGQLSTQTTHLPLADGNLYLNVGTVDTASLTSLEAASLRAFLPNRTVVVQLDGPMTPEKRGALEAVGAIPGDYLPKNAFTVEMTGVDADVLTALPFVTWIGEYQNAWKLDPGLGQRAFQTAERQAMADQGQVAVLITLFRGRSAADAVQEMNAIDGLAVHYTSAIGDNEVISATMPLANVAAIAQFASVQYVEEAAEITFRNSTNRWIVQSNVNNVTPLYDNGIRGEGQIVGVLDGRPDQQHCSLDGGKILFYNSTDGNNTHGTHVSATAVGDNGVNDNTRGVAYMANMVFNTIPSFTEAGIVERLNTHGGQGARMHTNSWGDDGTTSYNSLARGFDVFLHDNEDHIVMLAVTNLGALKNPENAKNLLAVGASQDTPNQASHCTGGAGPTADGRRKPEIYAPGCSTTSATPSACGTTNLTGTSMASPAVTGTAALVRQYYVDGYHPSGVATGVDAFTPSGALLKATLLNSAVDMTGVTGYPSNTEGWGRVLADDALFFPGDARRLAVLDDVRNASGLSTGQAPEYFLDVISSVEKLKVTLVWADAAAAASTGTGFAAVNDLDLEVVAPNSSLFLGNVFSGGVSVTGGAKDDRNNVEQVHINSPQTGLWTIRVRAAGVNQGPQGYALIATDAVVPNLPALTVSLPSGTPDMIPPGVATAFDVDIAAGQENVQAGTETLFYRYDGGAFQASPLTFVGGNLYTATLPAAACADSPEFYVSAQGDGGTTVTNPSDAPASFFTAVVGETLVAFSDNFETDQGWVPANLGATTGDWERGVPVDDAGWAYDPATDSDGSGQCYLTMNQIGNTDVDNGAVELKSPIIDMSAGNITISYDYYLRLTDTDGSDRILVEISSNGDAGPWTEIDRHDTDGGLSWRSNTITQADLDLAGITLTANMKLRFNANDAGTQSINESGLDAFQVTSFPCVDAPVVCTKGDLTNDGNVDGRDIDLFVEIMINGGGTLEEQCAGDVEAVPDSTIDLDDLPNFVTCLLQAGCP